MRWSFFFAQVRLPSPVAIRLTFHHQPLERVPKNIKCIIHNFIFFEDYRIHDDYYCTFIYKIHRSTSVPHTHIKFLKRRRYFRFDNSNISVFIKSHNISYTFTVNLAQHYFPRYLRFSKMYYLYHTMF